MQYCMHPWAVFDRYTPTNFFLPFPPAATRFWRNYSYAVLRYFFLIYLKFILYSKLISLYILKFLKYHLERQHISRQRDYRRKWSKLSNWQPHATTQPLSHPPQFDLRYSHVETDSRVVKALEIYIKFVKYLLNLGMLPS